MAEPSPTSPEVNWTRRRCLGALAAWPAYAAIAGCRQSAASTPSVDAVWGRRGISDGRLQRPRAIAIDDNDLLYIVDITGRIQVFDGDGQLLRLWRTPAIEFGKPVGLAIGIGRRVLVADTHYHRLLTYTHTGRLLTKHTIGGEEGTAPGQFGFVTDAVQTDDGCYYVGEYGQNDRIQKFDPEGRFLLQFGGHGGEPGQFRRPQSLKLGPDGLLWVADACNHRLQVFDISGNKPQLVDVWGRPGHGVGELQFPYDLAFGARHDLYVCEFGNQRVQRFSLSGQSLGIWGAPGRGPGQLSRPWGIVANSNNQLFVLDTYNHRVQRLAIG